MEFDALPEVLRGFVGKWIDVSLSIPSFESTSPLELIGFSGAVERVAEGHRLGSGVWRVWLKETGPGPNAVSFTRSIFVSADFEADREEGDFMEGEHDPNDSHGLTWTLRVQQAGVLTEIIVYV